MSAWELQVLLTDRGVSDPARLAILLYANWVPNPALAPDSAARLLQLSNAFPWFLGYLFPDSKLPITRDLGLLAGNRFRTNIPVPESAEPEFKTLFRGPLINEVLDPLRAVLILARISTESNWLGRRISSSAVQNLSSRIRAIAFRGSAKLAGSALASLKGCKDLSSIRDAVTGDLVAANDEKSGFGQSWITSVVPLLDWLLSKQPPKPAKPDPVPAEPPPWNTPKIPWVYIDPFEPDDFGPELSPIVVPVPAPPGKAVPSAKTVAAFRDQALRGRNSELIKDHVEVATDQEVALLIEYCRDLDRAIPDTSELLVDPAQMLLVLVTGRAEDPLQALEIAEKLSDTSPVQFQISLDQGVLAFPVMTLPQAFRPAEVDGAAFEPINPRVVLPVPALLRSLLLKIPASARSQLFQPATQPETFQSRMFRFLRAVPRMPAAACHPARFRRWLGCQIQDLGLDLAKTLLLCGDSFGRSTAPLYYYSASHAGLRDLYTRALTPVFKDFGGLVATAPGQPEARTGPAFVARPELAQRGVSQLSKRLSGGLDHAMSSIERARLHHNAWTDYIVRYFSIITLHRPTKKLYGVTRRQVDLLNLLAMLEDKRSDPAHFTRLAALTRRLGEALSAYLDHLDAMANMAGAPPSWRLWANKARVGDAPLFGYVDGDLEFRSGSTDDWTRSTPVAWEKLPPNWHRSFLSTSLREHAVPPMAVMAQAGHLEAASYPFSEQSCVSPIEVVASVRPALQTLERNLGFRREGLAGHTIAAPPPSALIDWSGPLQKHRRDGLSAAREQRSLVRSQLRCHRQGSVQWLETQLAGETDLLAVIQQLQDDPRGRVPDHLRKKAVSEPLVDRVLEENNRQHDQDDARRIAIHNRLCIWLRAAVRKADWSSPDIGLISLAGNIAHSPLLIDGTLATEQLQYLRNHLHDLFRTGADIARPALRFLTLVTHDFSLTLEEMCALAMDPAAHLVWLEPDGDPVAVLPGRRGPIALSGFSRLALLASSKVDTQGVSQALADSVRSTLPVALLPADTTDILERLWQTAAVAARIEHPGLLRNALSVDGAIGAPSEQLAAFRTGVALPLIGAGHSEPFDGGDISSRRTPDEAVDRKVRDEYKKLLAAFRKLPASSNAASGRPKGRKRSRPVVSLAELRLKIGDPAPSNSDPSRPLCIQTALQQFVRSMCDHGTRKTEHPAVSTVYEYLTTVGRPLIDIFGNWNLRALSVDDLESGYELAAMAMGILRPEGRSGRQQAERAAMVLEDFQLMLESEFGMPKVLTPWPPNHNAVLDPRPDPLLLNRKHYELARNRLLVECDPSDTSGFADISRRRLIVLALVVLMLLRHTGARLSEILGLRFSDVHKVADRIDLIIRPSRFRRLKTGAARRRIRIDHRLSDVEKEWLERWLESEHYRQTLETGEAVLVFSEIGPDISMISSDAVRRTIQAAFECSSGTEMWPHLLRHLWASEEIPDAFRSIEFPDCLWTALPPPQRIRALELRRHEIGHAWLSTSFQHYVHTAHELKRRCEGNHLEATVDRWTLAGYSGLSVDNIYKARQRDLADLDASDPILAGRWHTAAARRQERLGVTVSPIASPKRASALTLPAIRPATLWDLSRLLRTASDLKKLGLVAWSYGLSDRDQRRLIEVIDRLGRKVHFRMFEGVTRRGSIRRNPKARFTNPRQLQSWLMSFDLALLPGLAAAFEASFHPFDARRDRLTGDKQQLELIRSAMSLPRSTLINGADTSNDAVLQFEHEVGRIGVFHQACWALAIAWVWVELQK